MENREGKNICTSSVTEIFVLFSYRLLLRIQTDDSASVCRFSMKYGAHPDTCQFLLDTAKLLELDVIGIRFVDILQYYIYAKNM